MPDQISSIVSRVWCLYNPLREGSISYGGYLEQLAYPISLEDSK